MRVSGDVARRIFAGALGAAAPFAPSGSSPIAELAIRIDPVAAEPRVHCTFGTELLIPVDVIRGLAAEDAGEALLDAGVPEPDAAALAPRAADAWDVFARAEALSLDATIARLVSDRALKSARAPTARETSGARAGNGAAFLDCALVLDPRAFARQAWLEACLESDASLELALWKDGIDYVPLDGDLGLLCIGAGMTLAMIDRLRDAGARPCAFLDVTRNYSVEGIARALGVLLDRHGARALAVNVFGGITRMDDLAANLAEALARRGPGVPVVVRLEGTRGEAGRATLERAGISVAGSSAEVIAFARSVASGGSGAR